MAVAEWTAGGVAFGNAVWAYGALLMLDPKASTHVQWPESQKANAWHQARRASNSHLYPSSDVLYAAMGPFILDSSNEPWIFKLAENLKGGATSPSGTTPVLTSTPWGLRTVHTGYAYRPPACCTYPGGTGQLAARGRTHGTVRIHRTRTGLWRAVLLPCTDRVAPQATERACARARRQQRQIHRQGGRGDRPGPAEHTVVPAESPRQQGLREELYTHRAHIQAER